MINSKGYLKVASEAAKQSGKIFKSYFGHPKKISIKNGNPRDMVTEVDLRIEKLIRSAIAKKFPSHKFIGEESVKPELEKNDLVWIIDPIDGTTNFIHGLPICCISIALWDSNGPLVSVIYNPILNNFFTAQRGQGAYLNGKKINVSNKTYLMEAYGGYGWGRDVNKAAQNFPKLIKILNKIRTLGSSTMELCYVGCGIYDFHIQARIKVWDFAAAILIITEAGGKVTDWQGNKPVLNTENLISCNNKLHSQLIQRVKSLKK